MKVIILAGGFGTRLGNITDLIPKPMVNIGPKPTIWHIMKIYSHYGYKDFIVSLGYKQEIVKEYFHNYHVGATDFHINLGTRKIKTLSDHDEQNWRITLINTGLNAQKGARIKRVAKYLDNGLNMMTYGDGVADINIKDLVKFHKSHGKLLTITAVHPPSRFGEIIEKNSRLIGFKEKPQSSVGLINGGFFVFDKKMLKYFTDDDNCDLEYVTLEKLVKLNQVMVYKHLSNWECIDTERDLRHLNKLWDDGKAFWKIWK